ncbi:uncharacterized protein LOC125825398 [Solanum verrucosum]|uniref:uncharacterized protein LOC125825398 n=1 Tax=Solanum verrucosum TaxID=315347 RepID=UPI0020D0E142|nr:uncharacterized protein LOC125825398 [Solanum verrucosum]
MDPLKYTFQKPMPTGKLAKWQILLSKFDIVYVTQKAIKRQALADYLAKNPVDQDYMPLTTYFPDEEGLFVGEDVSESYDGCMMFFDEASNSIGVEIGAVLISETGQYYPISAKIRFYCTNNMAEYEACILGLRMAIDMSIKELLVIGDSDLLVHQVQGEWATKNIKILPYLHYIKDLSRRFTKIELKHVPRAQNEFTDALNYDIRRLIEAQEYPENATSKQKRTLKRIANHFFLNGEIIYRITSDLGLLRCVDTAEETRLLEVIHAGTYGPHMNGFTLAKKILRAGYFWMTMERDSIQYMQMCHQCQVHGDFIRVPPNELNVMGSLWPFATWGMDVSRPIELPVSNGHRFILVAIDYFIKWVKASTYKAMTKKVVADFVRNNIVCRFGIP